VKDIDMIYKSLPAKKEAFISQEKAGKRRGLFITEKKAKCILTSKSNPITYPNVV
jgi:hypothetical protein